MMRGSYSIPEKGGILVPRVQFFRADPDADPTESYAFLAKPFSVDVFASAAYNLPALNKRMTPGGWAGFEKHYELNTKGKIRTMFRAAILNGNDSLVLSAFGCGAFKNNPQTIAGFYRDILLEDEFRRRFRRIAFAILDNHNGTNFEIFKDVLVGSASQ
jgi:uncharacterized protein (TIGR02452 family)